jgi:siroheme synthase (precorrin-2 oxidase/ferrochelatase)
MAGWITYLIFVDVRDRLVVVIGGGHVAQRKTEHLLKAHARVRVIAPQLCAELAVYRDLGRIETGRCRSPPRSLTALHWSSPRPTMNR